MSTYACGLKAEWVGGWIGAVGGSGVVGDQRILETNTTESKGLFT